MKLATTVEEQKAAIIESYMGWVEAAFENTSNQLKDTIQVKELIILPNINIMLDHLITLSKGITLNMN